jgi:hypothetical protein
VNHLVLSGTATHLLSGTGSSCYRGPKSGVRFWRSTSFRARNFTNLESFGFFLTDHPFFAAVGARGFANWCKVSRNGSRIRELDSRIRNCNSRQRPIFTSFSVTRSPTYALQFSSPVSSRTRHIQKPVRKPGTHASALTRCKDSDPHFCRFTKPRAPTAAGDNRRSVTQSATIGALLNASADCEATLTPNLASFSVRQFSCEGGVA